MSREEVNYMHIIPVKCDCCGRMVGTYSSKAKGAWFAKYLKPNEEKVCRNCMKDREGYAEEFLEIFKIPLENLL